MRKHQYVKDLLIFSVCLFISFITSVASASNTQIKNPLDILKDQVDAFNKRDIGRLVKNVSDDFKWYSITADQLLIESKNKASFKDGMEKYYQARPQIITSKIDSYVIDGSRISFKEVVSHKNKKGEMVSSSAMGIYQMKDGKIFRAWYFIE
ncbi:MAG: nuclear transport factor 2 family protein [Kangiellaceae bacterium]